MTNTLLDLAQEYTQSADAMTQMIRHGNTLMRQAHAAHDVSRARQLRMRQQDLYVQRAYLLETAAKLRFYYRHTRQQDNIS